MKTKLDFENPGSFLTWAVCHAMVAMEDILGKEEVNAFVQEYRATGEVDVRLSINGREVPFNDFIDRLKYSLELEAQEVAKQLVEDRFSKVFDLLKSLEDSLKLALNDPK
jgi:hypothetical protein